MDLCELSEQLWKWYLSEDQEQELQFLSYLASDCIVIGTGMHEKYSSRDDFARALQHVIDDHPGLEFKYKNFHCSEKVLSSDCSMVSGGLKLEIINPIDKSDFMMRSRFTLVYCRQNGEWKLVHIHHSVPNLEQMDGEYLPKPLSSRMMEFKNTVEELKRLAERDGLTDLINLRTLTQIFGTADQEGAWLVMVDLDNFKHVNDTFGHVAGNEVLRDVACILRECVREEDAVARIGGDEFAILLGRMSLETARERLDSIMHRMEETRRLKECWVTLSMGAVQVQKGESLRDAVARADRKLYLCKDNGKNNYSIA